VPLPLYIEHATRSLPPGEAPFAALVLGMDAGARGTWGSP
jgi:hypothetical protein